MSKRLLGFICLCIFIFPGEAAAEAWIDQDSCVVFEREGQFYVRIYFSLLNNAPSDSLCGFDLIPQTDPPQSGCDVLELGCPDGWHANLAPGGDVEWFVILPRYCIDHSDSEGGFHIVLDPPYGCFTMQFCGNGGTLLLEDEACLDCMEVSAESRSWGAIKNFYHNH